MILREFVEVNRATNKSTVANAREFRDFLSARWRFEPSKPAYLPDVVECELAMAEVRNVIEEHEKPAKTSESDARKVGIRHRRSVVPLRCAHDIRSIFGIDSGEIVPPKRNTSLVVALPAGKSDVRIVEVAPLIVDALTLLADWVHPSTLDAFGDCENLIRYLATHEFIEMLA